jgi:hypothetical protein
MIWRSATQVETQLPVLSDDVLKEVPDTNCQFVPVGKPMSDFESHPPAKSNAMTKSPSLVF